MKRGRTIAIAAVAVALAVLLGACGSSSDSSKDGASSGGKPAVYERGDSIKAKVGDEFVVALEANPTTGYEWTAADNPDVTFVSSKQVQPSNGMMGAPGTQRLTFRATKAGTTTLVLNYARSFEPDVPPVQTERFPVTVDR